MAQPQNNAAAAKDAAAPRARAGTAPQAPADTGAGADTAVLEREEGAKDVNGPAEKEQAQYVTHADLANMAERILKGFEDRMAKRAHAEARERPAMRSNGFDVEDLSTQERYLDIPVEAFDIDQLQRPDLVVETNPDAADAAIAAQRGMERQRAMLAFLNERVLIVIAESTNQNDQPVCTFWNNGIPVHITRGEPTWVRRKYVETIARAKPADYQIQVVRNGDGDVTNRAKRKTAMAFPFSVVEDRNPRGRAWLLAVQKEAS